MPPRVTVLTLFSKDDKDKDSKVYRVDPKQKFVWVAPESKSAADHFSKSKQTRETTYTDLNKKLKESHNGSPTKRIVVVNETRGHDFYETGLKDSFLDYFLPNGNDNTWLVYHMANPSSQDKKKENDLWKRIKEKKKNHLKQTLVVVSAASLRSAGFYVDQQAALETIAEDPLRWLKSSNDFPIKELEKLPAHLIVRCDYDSVIHFYSLNEQDSRRKLHIYSRPFEGNPQSNEALYGKMPGYGRILVASMIQRLAQPFPPLPNQSDPKVIRNGICDGLRRTAAHFRNGFASEKFGENYSKPNTPPPLPFENLFRRDLGRDLELLFKDYPRDDYKNIGTPIQDKEPELPLLAKITIPWTELEKEEPEENKSKSWVRSKC